MPPMLIDVSRLVGRAIKGRLPTGVDRVMLEYVRHYGPRARAVLHVRDRFRVLAPAASQRLFGRLLAPPDGRRGFGAYAIGALARDILLGDGAAGLGGALLLNLGHLNLHRASHQRFLLRHGIKPVYFIHDLIPLSHPEYCRAGEAALHAARISHALEYGTGLIANSQATLDDVAAFAGRRGLALPPAAVAFLAPGTSCAVRGADRPVAAPYFVMLGTIEARKNHLMILQVWRQLVLRTGPAAPKLVIIGQRGWECEQAIDLLDRCEALRGAVIENNACSDADVARYLRHACALLFPSFAEGFGMPLVEALQAGTPAIASDLATFREIAGDIPDYLDPVDGLGWMRAVEAYAAAGSKPRAAQIERLAAYRVPDWEGHFAIVQPFLESLA